MSRRLLVTGAAGFIGANFVHYWLQRHPDDFVVAYDALTYAGNRANLQSLEGAPGLRFVHADIRDQERVQALLQEERLDTIVHFAAESHVDHSITDPDAFINTNVLGTHSLLKAARAVWLDGKLNGRPHSGALNSGALNSGGLNGAVLPHRFHHVSTDEVYGSLGPQDPAFTEQHKYAPNSPYAASKAASDHLVRAYHHTYGLQVTTSNCSNNYGPWHYPEKLIPLCLTNILRGRPLPVYGDGKDVRDWLYVRDHCAGIERILQDGQPGQTYNIGGGAGNIGNGNADGGGSGVNGGTDGGNVGGGVGVDGGNTSGGAGSGSELTNIDVVCMLCDRLNARFAADSTLARRFPHSPAVSGEARGLIEHVADRPGHDRRYAIDASKIKRELGFQPQYSFERGIDTTIDWFLNNEDWWQGLVKK